MEELATEKQAKDGLLLSKRESTVSQLTTQRKSQRDDSQDQIKESPRNSHISGRKPIRADGYLCLLSKASSFWKSKFSLVNEKKEK
jgi:hypothetical protein